MDEGDRGAPGSGAGDLVDGPSAGGHDGGKGRCAVVDPVADVVDALAPFLEKPAYGRVGSGSRRELEVGQIGRAHV